MVGDARARIAIYGSDGVVRAMGATADHPLLTTRDACRTFVCVCRAMRADTQASNALSDDELSLVVLGRALMDFPES